MFLKFYVVGMCCLQDFEWSPAEPLLAAYTQEVGDRPANITLYRIPERTNVRSKQLFNVSGELAACDWHVTIKSTAIVPAVHLLE